MKVKEIRELSPEAIVNTIEEYQHTLNELKYSNSLKPVENPNRIALLRKDIARLYTVLNEKNQEQA